MLKMKDYRCEEQGRSASKPRSVKDMTCVLKSWKANEEHQRGSIKTVKVGSQDAAPAVSISKPFLPAKFTILLTTTQLNHLSASGNIIAIQTISVWHVDLRLPANTPKQERLSEFTVSKRWRILK